jgi:hypothetical protein
MPQANALNSIGSDTVQFLTICKLDIYQLKSLGKSATVFIRVTNNYWLPTYLIFSAIDIRLTNIRRLYIYSIIIASDIPFCKGNMFFALTALYLLN